MVIRSPPSQTDSFWVEILALGCNPTANISLCRHLCTSDNLKRHEMTSEHIISYTGTINYFAGSRIVDVEDVGDKNSSGL